MAPAEDVNRREIEINRGEIEKLRNWRHDVAVPALASLTGRLRELERRMDDLEPEVERMARAADIAKAVADNLHAHRIGFLTTWEKAAGILVGVAAVASVLLQLFHH